MSTSLRNRRSSRLAAGLTVAVVLASAWTAGCDSNEDKPEPAEVAGEYRFTELRFVPLSSAVQSVNVLDTLVTSATRLQLFSSGRFTLLYQFEGERAEFIGGDFSVSSSRVVLKGEKDQERFYRALLLDLETSLVREQDDVTLNGNVRRKVNLEAFSPRYRGLPSVEGDMKITLVRD